MDGGIMKHFAKLIGIGVCVINLSSCMVDQGYSTIGYQRYDYHDAQLYSQMDYGYSDYGYQNQSQGVDVPDSYHVGESHAPVSFKDRDKQWVSSQNPQGYTIELADDEKAAAVAKKLYQAPKTDRRAQIQYQKNGKPYYKGVYGSYDSQEAAEKALDQLPPEVKQGAGVKNWSNVQGN
jgi:hypothetical protein